MRIIILAIFFLWFIPPHVANAGELQDRERIESAARNNLYFENFSQLEADSNAYRREKSRTSSGLWKLTLFYVGISQTLEFNGDPVEAEKFFVEMEGKTKAWLKKYPNSPAANIAYAMMLHNRGWGYRGEEYASRVKPESWAPFRKYVAAARAHLESTKSVASVDPRWYELMLNIGRAQGWERQQFDKLFAEAVGREPLFYQHYFSALEYLLPKWHGDIAEIEKFSRNAVKLTSATEGKGMYARIYWFASQTHYELDIFTGTKVSWKEMKASFEDVIARYPDAWNLNNFAKFACLARDKNKAAELIKRTESEIIPEAWPSRTARDACKTFVYQSTS